MYAVTQGRATLNVRSLSCAVGLSNTLADRKHIPAVVTLGTSVVYTSGDPVLPVVVRQKGRPWSSS